MSEYESEEEYSYEGSQVARVLESGPREDSNFYGLKITGRDSTKYMSVTEDQVRRITAILRENG